MDLKIIKNITQIITINGIGAILVIIQGVIITRLLGVDNYGEYTFIIATISLLSMPTKTGIATLIVREMIGAIKQKIWDVARGVVVFSFVYVTIYTISIIIVINSLMYAYNYQRELVIYEIILIFLFGYEATRASILKSINKVKISQALEKLVKPSIIIIVCILIDNYYSYLDVKSVLGITIVAIMAVSMISFLIIKNKLPEKMKRVKSRNKAGEWLKSIWDMGIFQGLKVVESSITLVLIGIFLTDKDVSYAKITFTIGALLIFVQTATNIWIGPLIARMNLEENRKDIIKVLRQGALMSSIFTFVVGIGIVYYGKDLISLLYGVEFIDAATSLWIIFFAQLVNTSFGSIGVLINMTKNEKYLRYPAVFSILTNIFIFYIFYQNLGYQAGVLGYAISIIFWNILLHYICVKNLKINIIGNNFGYIR